MPVYFARWRDASFSVVTADSEDEAHELLDEFGDEPVELSQMNSCMIDFVLTDQGTFRLNEFGEVTRDEILELGYPLLEQALAKAADADDYVPEDKDVDSSADVPSAILDAAQAERRRFDEFQRTPASTELGKQIQARTNISGRNADSIVRRKASDRLKRFHPSGKKPN